MTSNSRLPDPGMRPGAGAAALETVLAAVVCNALEFFDFVAYAFFAPTIAHVFFPAAAPGLALLLAVAVFGVGFVARPVGGVVLGRYADRAGRRPALLLTTAVMTLGTLGLACTPGYAAIGAWAPALVTVCRLVQGFALGGETGPSTAFLLEVAPPGRRAGYVALQVASQGIASVLAGGLGLALALTLGARPMAEWGWRVPFAVSVLLIPVALFLRHRMPETLERHGAAPALRAVRGSRPVVLGILIVAGGTVSTYVSSYMATYGTVVLHLPPADGLQAAIVIGLATVAGALAGGRLADRWGRWPMMFWPRLVTAIACIPAFAWLAAHPDGRTLQVISAMLAFLTALTAGGVLTTICELFGARERAAALALVYSVGVSVFGGSVQFVVTWLIGVTGSPLAPAWCIAAASVAAVVATLMLPETRPHPRAAAANIF